MVADTYPIKRVVFDLGGVLVNWKPRDVVAEMFDSTDLRDTVMRSVFEHQDWLEIDRGTLNEAEAITRFAARTRISKHLIHELMDRVRSSLTLIPEMATLVRKLVEYDFPVYVLSNMSDSTFSFLSERYKIWAAFSGIVISGRIGKVKPEAQIYKHLVSEYGLNEAECLFIDDTAANIAAADRLRFQTILFRQHKDCADELLARLDIQGP